MIQHVWGLFAHPSQEWREIRDKDTNSQMYLVYALILAAIPAISAYIGTTHMGWAHNAAGAPVMLTQTSALQLSVCAYLAMLVGVGLMGGFIHWMSRTYSATPSLKESIAFAAYNATPLFIGGLSALYPNMWLGMLVGTAAICYTVYLLYVGIPSFMKIPEDEGFMFSSSILAVGLVLLVTMIVCSILLWEMGLGPVYTGR